jgi:hypothetical protein
MWDTMHRLHQISLAILLHRLRHSKIHVMAMAAELLLHTEVLLLIHLQAQIQLSSWYHQLANNGRNNKHRNLHQPQTLTQHPLKVECL